MLDLGGGPGLIGIAIVGAHPGMKGVIFDRPAIIGEGYDLIWASSALSLAKDDMDSLTKKIYDALNPGGVFLVLHEGLTYERTKPDVMVVHARWIRTGVRWIWMLVGRRKDGRRNTK
jgi:hypothetical protein